MVERVWQWHFAASPERLWPVLADTARLNEAMGLPRYAVAETPLPDGGVRRIGSATVFGLQVAWEEGVPEWVAPRRFRHQRRLLSGPLRRIEAEITLDPAGAGGTRVAYRLEIEPRWWFIDPLLRLGFLPHFGRRLDRLYRQAAEFARAGGEIGPWPAAEPPPQAVRERVATRSNTVAEQGHAAAPLLAAHLLAAADRDLERMRPRVLARHWRVAPREAIETCLAATRAGLLTLRWDLICPRCRGAKAAATSLDQLPQGAHCPSCNIRFDRDFSRNVEVTFDPAEDIRPLGIGTYCLASPLAAAHIKVQRHLAPGEIAAIAAAPADGEYRARTVEAGGAADFHVADGVLPAVTLGADGPMLSAGERDLLRVHNAAATDRTLVVEDRAWAADALTAHELTTMQAFRDLFADAVLRPGDQVEIRRIALMFTDIRGSTDLYNRVGDAQAYGWVREHFAVLAAAVRRHDGALVKTIGDAVMAAFSNPADALAAALDIRGDIAAFNRTLTPPRGLGEVAIAVRLGLHCGPCIAVTLNDRLDYFGSTVNLASRLEHESRGGGDIVLSETMAAEPGIAALLAPLAPTRESARLRGFAEPMPLLRIPAAG